MLYRFDGFQLDTLRRELLTRSGKSLSIPPRALDLLLLLVRNREVVLTKDELRKALWPDTAVAEASLFECVASARRALEPAGSRLIRTVHGRGYTFAGTLEEVRAHARLPSSYETDLASAFVGRGEMLLAFEQVLERTLPPARPGDRTGSLILVAGGPGQGKSRLLREFAGLSRAAGCATVQGHCSEIAGAPAYWPWAQAIRQLRNAMPRTVPPALWQEVMALDSPRTPASSGIAREAGAARFQLFDATGELLRRITTARPVVILLDDMHRADLPSLRLLTYLAEELPNLGTVLVVAHREFELLDDVERSAVFSRLSRAFCTRTLRVDGLTCEDVLKLARSVLGSIAAHSFARRLHEHTAGNPFFVHQLLSLAARSDLDRDPELPRELPPTVRGAVVRHLDALPSETRSLLAIAAVLGRGFDVSLLAQTSDTTAAWVLEQLAPAIVAGVIDASGASGGVYRFRHILVRDALYEEWTEDQQARWHLAAAKALQDRHTVHERSHVAEIAAHYLRAAPIGAAAEAARYATAAGQWALEQLAFEEAAEQLQRALQLGDIHGILTPAERCDLLVDLGAARNACGDRSSARGALDEAARTAGRLGDWRRMAQAALAASPGFFAIETGVQDRPLIALLEAALALCPTAEAALRAQLLCRLAMAVYWSSDSSRRRDLSDEAYRLARRVEDPRVLAHAAATRFLAYWAADNCNDRAKQADAIVETAESAGDQELGLMCRVFRISTLLECGEIDTFAREARVLRHIIEAGRYPQAGWYPLLYEATVALVRGELDSVESYVDQYASIGERFGDVNASASMSVHLVLLDLLRDDLQEACNLVRLAVRGPHAVPAHRCALALCSALAGRDDVALAAVRELSSNRFSSVPRDMLWLFSMTVLGEAIAVLNHRTAARECYDILAPHGGQLATIGYGIALWGPVDRALGLLAGLLGDYALAESHLRRALKDCDRIGARTISVGTRLNWAQLLKKRCEPGDGNRVSEISEPALREAQEMGLAYYERQLEELLRS